MNTNKSNNKAASSSHGNGNLMSIDLSDHEERKPTRAINFAEKIHLVLSHDDCKGKDVISLLFLLCLLQTI